MQLYIKTMINRAHKILVSLVKDTTRYIYADVCIVKDDGQSSYS